MNRRGFCGFLSLTLLLAAQTLYAQDDKPIFAAGATTKFSTPPGVPACASSAAVKGDPSQGASVLAIKAGTGCVIPWHWHTPNEQVMMVSGRAKVEMKDGAPVTVHAGDFLFMPSKHAHQFTCLSACSMFDVSEGAFDIHYVDKDGNEIPPDQAFKQKAKSKAMGATKKPAQ